jgi:hypothetical protein
LIAEIQSFIYQYNLRGRPVPSATSLLGLPGLRPTILNGVEANLRGVLQDDLFVKRLEERGLCELVTLQQKVVLQLLDRYSKEITIYTHFLNSSLL